MSSCRIIAAQLNFTVGDTQGNLQRIQQAIIQARDELGADLILFPELALTGYPPEDLLFRQAYLDEVETALESVISLTQGVAVLIGHPQQTPLGLTNAVSVFENNKWLCTYHKQSLPNTQVFDEKRYFEPGRDSVVVTLKGIKFGLLICEDIWHAEPLQNLKLSSAQAVLVVNASPFSIDKLASRHAMLKAQARSVALPIVYVNMVGAQDELIFDGGSFVVDPLGNIVSQAPVFEETLWPIELHSHPPEVSVPLQALTVLPDPVASVYDALVMGVRDYYHKNRFSGIVLGLSGGVDSALTLALAVDAVGAERVEALLLPSRYTSELSHTLALEQTQMLEVKADLLSIDEIYQASLRVLSHGMHDAHPDVTQQNLQARCRGLLVMAVSNKTGYLVLTTGNKSEYAVGYTTLYGDMCGGYAPLKDVSKTWVYQLCDYRNQLSQAIPLGVITRPPTAELAPNQLDSDSLPEYPLLDKILALYVEQGQSIEQIVASGYPEEMVKKIIHLLYQNEYKRRQSAPGPKVTQKAFGRDRRYPITSGYR